MYARCLFWIEDQYIICQHYFILFYELDVTVVETSWSVKFSVKLNIFVCMIYKSAPLFKSTTRSRYSNTMVVQIIQLRIWKVDILATTFWYWMYTWTKIDRLLKSSCWIFLKVNCPIVFRLIPFWWNFTIGHCKYKPKLS